MNSNKLIYTIAAVILIAAGAITVFRLSSPSTEDQVKEQAQNNQNNNQAALPKDANGCPNGVDPMPISGTTRYQPTIDISNQDVVLETSMGKIQIDLYDQDAPKTVENFICLAKKGYYNGVTFHRVAKGFVVQAGDPTGTGAGGESIYGSTFEDELYPDTPSYKAGYVKGVVAMANKGVDTNTSQFFIMLETQPLPNNYTIFGKVTLGMDVVEKMGNVAITPQLGPNDGTPKQPITINKATVVAK